jgi:hypothetical protein
MKKSFFVVIFVFIIAGLLFLSWLYFSKKEELSNVSVSLVAAEYPTKVVYNLSAGDELSFMADCKKRKGTFNNCGSSCEESASFCAAVCVPVCEFEKTVLYKSEKLGFEIKYPENLMQVDANDASITTFVILGETQKTGSEFFDGLMLTVAKAPKPKDKPLQQIVQDKINELLPLSDILVVAKPIEINKQKGFTYTEKTVGLMTHLYFENATDIYEISYTAPDPRNQGYAKLAEKMIQSFLIKE